MNSSLTLICENLWFFLRKSAGTHPIQNQKNHNPDELWFYFGTYCLITFRQGHWHRIRSRGFRW